MWPFRLWRWRFEIQQAADKYGFEPALIAAIMERESQGGEALTPPTRLGTGDGGHGRGLLQIDDRAHPAFCSNIELWGDALQYVMFGAMVLDWGRKTTGGHIEGAVACYNTGWAREKNGVIIPHLRELYASVKPRLPTIEELDRYTTGHDYVKFVMDKFAVYKKIQFT